MAFFGLDIGSDTIKIAQLSKEGNKFRLVSAGMTKTPGIGLASEAEKDLIAVAEAIKKLKTDAGINSFQVVSSLPDSGVFTKVIDLPVMTEEEIGQALRWELEEIVPISLSEANYDWQIINKESSKISLLVAVAPKALINKYLRVFELADLQPLALETEVLAVTRVLSLLPTDKAKLVVDFGSKSTNIVCTMGEQIISTRSLPAAGQAITRSISSNLAFDEETAEEYKKAYGLLTEQYEGKIAGAIQPILKSIITEIKKSLDFFKEEKKEEIKMIVLTGGGANLPGLSEMLARELGVEVQTADPFANLGCDKKLIATLRKFAPSFAIVIGLAMKEI